MMIMSAKRRLVTAFVNTIDRRTMSLAIIIVDASDQKIAHITIN